jgi:hypothetical protein
MTALGKKEVGRIMFRTNTKQEAINRNFSTMLAKEESITLKCNEDAILVLVATLVYIVKT